MEGDRREEERDGHRRGDERARVHDVGEVVGVAEPVLERDAEQEGEQDLGTGLDEPQLLEQLVPVPSYPGKGPAKACSVKRSAIT